MEDINSIITKTFNENISYIEQNHPQLFSKLLALDNAVSHSYYQERYELVYENGYFDVFEKKTNSYLYSKDSKVHASLAQESIDYTLEENLFEGFHKHAISLDDLKRYEKEKPFVHHMSGFAPIIYYTNSKSPKQKELKKINKFIFFGTGLGLHITSIHKKIKSDMYLIIEDDLELFRLSLFVTNYKEIALDAILFFCVFEDDNQFFTTSTNFLKTKHYYNHYIKYFHILSHSEEKIEQFHVAVTSQAHLLFFYHHLLRQYLTPLEYIFDDYRFLNISLSLSDKLTDEKPFLLLAAGPSLQKNMEWLKQNRDHFVVVALSATLSILEKEDIKPDIITHLDAFDAAKAHFDRLNSLEFIKDSICMFTARTPKEVVSMFDKERLFFFETGTQYKKLSLKPSAPCVGSLTYQLLLRLNVKNLYLLGLDLAIDSKTGKTHADGHEYVQTLKMPESSAQKDKMSFKDTLFYVDGNFTDKVQTTPNFKISIDAINQATKILKKESQSVFNLSDGAKFIGTLSKKPSDITLKSTQDMRAHIYNLCLKNFSSKLDENEIKNLYNKLSHAREMQNIIMNHSKNERSDAKEYLEGLEKLCLSISSRENISNYELARVLDTYNQYILTYIFDFFNTAGLENEKEHIEKIDDFLVSHMLKIIDFYRNALDSRL
ncbi:motility associated factor glycosyltransferase family protein [Sulfurimonas crateris]|uniref:Motility associated factor glycosyltransferase family protein n=1 Tax=Sulfurimonas crateris TaxID=2574727 RepID=A0A4U2Z9S0_9BACT|nr:6-hydroxymethylpterin diphosphokinase MptE-like protein [Sulfurimonas crateris]TKI71029.1 motility associated factor glycosyltransferase family protein [Sulfurimonas crateris]